MGFKDVIQKLTSGNSERKALIKQIDMETRVNKLIQERQLSSNERELNRYEDEDREAYIKERLEYARKKRADDISFGHNPLDAKNIMKSKWEILREPNQFSKKSNMLNGENTVMKNNPNLLKSNQKLMKGGNMFKR